MNALPQVGDCCETCDDQVSVLVPGPAGVDGDAGSAGDDGLNAFTVTTDEFTVPAVGDTVQILVQESGWMAPGQKIYIQNAGYYQFVSSTSSINATVQNLGYTGNAAPTANVPTAQQVSPGGVKGADGTDGTDGTDSATVLTTKGDILTRTTVGESRLAIGANKRVLTADSSYPTGNTWSPIDLSGAATEIVGALPIANGGTGQITANPAFNALAPTTTRGDLIVRGAAVNARLALGATGTVPQSNGTDLVYGKVTMANIDAASGPLGRYGLLASLINADFNITSDQAITLISGVTRYIIRRIVVENASISLTTAAGGIYGAAAKSAPIIVAAAQVYSALTATTKKLDLTLEAVVGTDVFTAATLYLSLTTGQGAPATGNIWIFGENVT